MWRCVFFSNFDTASRNDNHIRIPNEIERAGSRVIRATHDSIYVQNGELACVDVDGNRHSLIDFDIFWVLGFGNKATFLDRMQLLRSLDQGRFVNSIDAFVFQHAKGGLRHAIFKALQPETFLSNNPNELRKFVDQKRDSSWIIKPNAGSFGFSTFVVKPNEPNLSSILETVCESGYALVQEMVDNRHEKRVLIAAGEIVGAFGRRGRDFRNNRAAGATPVTSSLNQEERTILEKVGDVLFNEGIRFATLDFSYPYLFDVNFVNPGWLATYEELTQEDLTGEVVRKILYSYSKHHFA